MVGEGQLLWTPSPEFVERSNLAQYMTWLKETHRIEAADYEALRNGRWPTLKRSGHRSGTISGCNRPSVKRGARPEHCICQEYLIQLSNLQLTKV
jgi:hypothetical protein